MKNIFAVVPIDHFKSDMVSIESLPIPLNHQRIVKEINIEVKYFFLYVNYNYIFSLINRQNNQLLHNVIE
jgi:hypothetical protein